MRSMIRSVGSSRSGLDGFAMFPSRKKFRYQVAPSDRQLWAIGMVVVQWSNLETLLSLTVQPLCANDTAVALEFSSTRAFKLRMDLFETLVERKIRDPERTDLLSIILAVKNLQQQRDRIVHGNWGSEEGAPIDNPSATGAFKWAVPSKPFEWKLDFGRIVKVARDIDEVHARLFSFLVQAAGNPPQFLVSDALKRISKTPNPLS